MNKEQLKEKIKESRATFREKKRHAYNNGAIQGLSIALTYIHQLEESRQVELPKILVNMIEESKGRGESLQTVLVEEYFSDSSEEIYSDEVYYAIDKYFDDFCLSYVTGNYVVKKDPKWRIKKKPYRKDTRTEYLSRVHEKSIEPIWRHVGEETPISYQNKEKAEIIANLVGGEVEEVESE